jgi:hypothetical protein
MAYILYRVAGAESENGGVTGEAEVRRKVSQKAEKEAEKTVPTGGEKVANLL